MTEESTLVERLESIDFARIVFPRGRKVNAEVFEVEAQKLEEGDYLECPSIFLTFGYNEEGVLNQVFISQGKSGGDENAHAQSLGILTSIGLQHGVPPQAFIRTLGGIKASVRPYEGEGKRIVHTSIEDLMARRLTEYVRGRNESLSLHELRDTDYVRPALSAPDHGNSEWKKLRFGDNRSPLYVHFDENEEGLLIGTFLERGKSGGDESAHAESLGKLISLSLQYGLHPFRVVRSLTGMISPSTIIADGHIYQSIEDAVGRSIFDWYGHRGVDLKKSYQRVMNGEEDPTSSLNAPSLPNFDLEDIGGGNGHIRPCPYCQSTDYNLMPISAKCGIYSCCNKSYGACD